MNYTLFKHKNVNYLLSDYKRDSDKHPRPNFMGTGKALAAILCETETVEQFLKHRLPKIKAAAQKRATEAVREHIKTRQK